VGAHNTDTRMNMGTSMRQIFIQQVGYGGATTRILTAPAPLTSLDMGKRNLPQLHSHCHPW